jgi:conjugal transfer mating pair stabilization protein TraN
MADISYVEKEKLLPKALLEPLKRLTLKTISLALVFILVSQSVIVPAEYIRNIKIGYNRSYILLPSTLYSIVSDITKNAYAMTFEEAINAGKTTGSDIGFTPSNINQKLQDVKSSVPYIQEAEQNTDYNQYYSDPASLSTVPQNEASAFVNEIYQTRQKFDLKNDPTFGFTCLEQDAEGKCIKQSLSDTILKSYPDCEEMSEPVYDAPPVYETCSGNLAIQTTPCEITTHVVVTSEIVYTPCSQTNPVYHKNQIYAACKDYYEWYQVGSASGSQWCNSPIDAFVVTTPPADAVYKLTCRNRQYYVRYKHSVIERVVTQTDSPCGANIEKWADECSVDKMELCDLSGSDCITAIENGERVGDALAPPDDFVKLSYGIKSDNCNTCPATTECDEDECYTQYNCPYGCVSGSCPSNAFLVTSLPATALKIGDEIVSHVNNCVEYYDEYGYPTNTPSRSYEHFGHFKVDSTCQSFSGSLRDYIICMRYFTVDLNAGSGFVTLSTTPVRKDGQCTEFGITKTWFEIYGGSDIKDHLNVYKAKINFKCDEASDNCQHLIDQGCVFYSQTCLDPPDCTQYEFIYKCGGTGGIIGYNKKVLCAGQIKCMGTECTDGSYDANKDFAAAMAATEILNMARADTYNIHIFPGKRFACQSSPKDCCKPTTGGVSIAKYVKAGRAVIKLYGIATSGFSASSLAAAGSIHSAISKIGLVNINTTQIVWQGSFWSFTTTTSSSSLGTTTVLTSTSTTSSGAVTTTSTVTSASGVMQTVGTIVTAAAVILAVAAIASLVYNILFGCDEDDLNTSVKLGFKLCHYLGKRCTDEVLGVCVRKEKVYCCFNSILARIIHQQGRPQIGLSWGSPDSPNCRGFTTGELGSIDFSKIDLTEYLQHVEYNTTPTVAPNILVPIAKNGAVTLSWIDDYTDETGFEIQRKDGSCTSSSSWGTIKITSQNVTSYEDTTTVSGSVYSYRVRALKSGDTYQWTSCVSVIGK